MELGDPNSSVDSNSDNIDFTKDELIFMLTQSKNVVCGSILETWNDFLLILIIYIF